MVALCCGGTPNAPREARGRTLPVSLLGVKRKKTKKALPIGTSNFKYFSSLVKAIVLFVLTALSQVIVLYLLKLDLGLTHLYLLIVFTR